MAGILWVFRNFLKKFLLISLSEDADLTLKKDMWFAEIDIVLENMSNFKRFFFYMELFALYFDLLLFYIEPSIVF